MREDEITNPELTADDAPSEPVSSETTDAVASEHSDVPTEESQEKPPQDTGESNNLQAQPVEKSQAIAQRPHLKELIRFHYEMNGLLAGKENLKIMAIDTKAKMAFYRKWVHEANSAFRITCDLRHRLAKSGRKVS